ncbi:hypothetical protein [Roseovarius sp.]|uniref:hypothetical protein n=1 Tax=Roseovarius sp. TaxID=1486281 RepID=UPI001B585B9A|nr:hypothetical protein [Roseovarius sp.]MBQ0809634.1 hypothetical protein [Roseovarius sp.]
MTRKGMMLAVLVLAGCTAFGPQMVARLGSDPVLSGGRYDSGGGLTVAADIREAQGRVLLCGVWAQSHQQSVLTKGKAVDVMGTGAVFLDGAALARGLVFMREVPPARDYGGQEAGCVLTERVWQAGYATAEPVIRLPRQVVHVEGDLGHFVVTFRQTGPGAGEPKAVQ